MVGTVFTPSLEGMKSVKSEQGEILTKPFLEACKHVLPVIDKFGAAMSIVKSDIGGNISRLETKYSSNPSEFNFLYTMIRAEVEAKTAKASSSCTNGLLWLTRAMDFLVELFRNLLAQPDWNMSQVCTDSYNKTLKKWHGWLASSSFTLPFELLNALGNPCNHGFGEGKLTMCEAHKEKGFDYITCNNFSVALKLAPDRKKFMDVIAGTGDVKADMEQFCANFAPLLEENHKFLVKSQSFLSGIKD
ncbi:Glycolipid transfer protein 1 [Asimina triloba]